MMRFHAKSAVLLLAVLSLMVPACTSSDDSGPAMPNIEPTSATSAIEVAPTAEAVAASPTAEPTEGTEVSEPGVIPPCIPVEGGAVDPCEQTLLPIRSQGHASVRVGDGPLSIRHYLEGGQTDLRAAHLVVRATSLPNTLRCVAHSTKRAGPWWGLSDHEVPGGIASIQCFADIRVNEYILGSGPASLTIVIESYHMAVADTTPYDRERWVGGLERAMLGGGIPPGFSSHYPAGGVLGREEIMFMGPAMNHVVEAWEAHKKWDVQRTDDGQVIAVHPARDSWLRRGEQYRSQVEMSLADLKAAVVAANRARLTEHGGRTGASLDTPLVQSDVTKLHQYHIAVGNTTHKDGPPSQEFPPPCGKAVPDHSGNRRLVRDCEALLSAKDALRGAGALNWSVDVPMAEWDGVRIEDGRVVALELDGKGLTGCVPSSLRKMAVDGLDALGLADCAG